jgi:molybdopterin-guanine dinucleotide biosynthesis protein A
MSQNDLKAIILIGGKSQRMGMDKARLSFFGKEQRFHLYDMLTHLGVESYWSVSYLTDYPDSRDISVIPDIYQDKGPMGAILSAWERLPGFALLVLSCDMPFLTEKSIQKLLDHRDPKACYTSYQIKGRNHPEPLCTIWEYSSRTLMKRHFNKRQLSLIQLMKNAKGNTLYPEDPDILFNVNHPKDLETAKTFIKDQKAS